MKVYYNDWDDYPAQWLRNLIAAGHLPPGDVDTRSITEVKPDDLAGYDQCHFFAGIGGWPLALLLAGWDGPVWTGSCPCQPFSSASRGRNIRREDDRNLWPVWARLVSECAPRVVFGEQVASAGDWFDEVCHDMETMGYAIGAAVLPACSVGFDHARARIFFACNADRNGEPGLRVDAEALRVPFYSRESECLAYEDGIPSTMGRLRAYGNAIVPQVGAAFVKAFMSLAP